MLKNNSVKYYSAIFAVTNISVLFLFLLFIGFDGSTVNAQENNKSESNNTQVTVDPEKLIHQCWEKYKEVKDYTCVFMKRERLGGKRKRLRGINRDRIVGGRLQEVETMSMKFREKPFSVYLKWIKDPNKGREIIYSSQGKYRNRLIVHLGGLLDLNLTKSPTDKDVLKASRNPITDAGIGNIIKRLLEDIKNPKKRAERRLLYIGTEVIEGGRDTYRILTMGPKNDYNVFYFVIIYIDKELMLPIKVACYDWDHTLQAVYTYTNLKLNVGLTDRDFDKNNRKYHFGGFPIKLF